MFSCTFLQMVGVLLTEPQAPHGRIGLPRQTVVLMSQAFKCTGVQTFRTAFVTIS